MRVKTVSVRCKGCGFCIEVCPHGCLVFSGKLNVRGVRPVEYDETNGKCKGCGNCVLMCPDLAIEIIESEDENSG